MDNFKKWQQATADLFKRQNLSQKHGLFRGLDLQPLGLEVDDQKVAPSFIAPGQFFNILPYQDDTVVEEFLMQPHAAVQLGQSWPDGLKSRDCFLYLKLSPVLTPFKKAVIDSKKFRKLDLGIDPFSLGLWKSTLFKSHLEAGVALSLLEKKSHCFRLSSQAYDLAGASDSQQLAILLSSVLQLIQDYDGLLTPSQVLKSLSIEVTLHSNLFLSMAKVNSIKLMLGRLFELLELDEEELPPVYTVASTRYMSLREPWNNLLKLTSMAASARMGGADGWLSLPFDVFSRDPQGYRISRNISEILELESHLGQSGLPAEGSYTLTQLTDQMCGKAWQLLGEIQNKEGLLSVLRSGWLYDQVRDSNDSLKNSFVSGEMKLVGSNYFPLVDALSEQTTFPKEEQLLNIEDWWEGQYEEADAESLCGVTRWIPESLPRLFEEWQLTADRLSLEPHGRPSLRCFVEPGMEKSEKLKIAQRIARLAGLSVDLSTSDEAKPFTIALVVATDHEAPFSQSLLSAWGAQGPILKLWAGERDVPEFDDFLGESADLVAVIGKIFSSFGRGL